MSPLFLPLFLYSSKVADRVVTIIGEGEENHGLLIAADMIGSF